MLDIVTSVKPQPLSHAPSGGRMRRARECVLDMDGRRHASTRGPVSPAPQSLLAGTGALVHGRHRPRALHLAGLDQLDKKSGLLEERGDRPIEVAAASDPLPGRRRRSCQRPTVTSGERPCSMNSNRPFAVRRRRISPCAHRRRVSNGQRRDENRSPPSLRRCAATARTPVLSSRSAPIERGDSDLTA